jgi:hypothetical protein
LLLRYDGTGAAWLGHRQVQVIAVEYVEIYRFSMSPQRVFGNLNHKFPVTLLSIEDQMIPMQQCAWARNLGFSNRKILICRLDDQSKDGLLCQTLD